jgi:hypothetical protein
VDESAAPSWVVSRVQERLAEHGSWDAVAVSTTEVGLRQLLFRIARSGKAHVFAVPYGVESRGEVDALVDAAVAQLGTLANGV